LRVAGIAEVAARLLLAEDAPGALRTGLSSPGGLLAVVGCPVGPGHRGCWAVRLQVALGAGVPVGLRGLRGWALGFALRVGGGPSLPPPRCAGAVPCGAVCVSALAVAAAACSPAWRTLGSLQLAAAAAAFNLKLAAPGGGCGVQVVGGAPACGIGTVVPRSSGAHCWYWAGGCRGGCSVDSLGIRESLRSMPMALVPLVRF
jgi:hypothetical protein